MTDIVDLSEVRAEREPREYDLETLDEDEIQVAFLEDGSIAILLDGSEAEGGLRFSVDTALFLGRALMDAAALSRAVSTGVVEFTS